LKRNKLDRLKIFLAVSSGFLLTLSFPRTGISWLAWVSLVPLLIGLRNLTPKKGFNLGLCAGLSHYITLVYWLAYTMSTYGNLPFYVSVPVLLLLSIYMALFVAIFSMATLHLCPNPFLLGFMPPLIWVSLEYIRSFLFTGFPWELIGYTQFNLLNIIQISDIFGVYGVSFCIVFGNTVAFLIYLRLAKKDWKQKRIQTRLAGGALAAFVIIFAAVWFYGKWRIYHIHELTVNSPSASVAVVQGNIDQAIKWDPEFQTSSTLKYVHLSFLTKKSKPDLVVWPETATPFYFLKNADLSELVLNGIRETGADFLIGSPSFGLAENTVEYFNSAYLIDSGGNIKGRYDKAHLVPFGEYVPLKKWLPFIGKMVEGIGDFRSGERGHTIQWGKYRIGIQICYEIIFPDLSRAMVKNDAALLINITNDAWYGRTSAPFQHFSMAVFRAVENRRSLIRSANTGISGFIDPTGKVIGSTPLFEDAIMTRKVPVLQKTTFYSRFGDVFALACSGVCLISVLCTFVYHLVRKFSG